MILMLALAAVLLGPLPCFAGEEKKLEVRSGDTMGDLLTKLVGSSVEVTLRNGTAMSGKLAMVHQHLAVLASLKGKEFYDAVIRIDDVSAVTVRMRDR
jgi:small nuclear ribonucleoprotein (snRNP)-like protein